MSNHTPGRWFLNPSNDGSVIRIEVPWGERAIAYVESGLSNARLIAAAPDLLEALRQITDYAEQLELVAMPNDWASDSPHVVKAKSAIAKAEGR